MLIKGLVVTIKEDTLSARITSKGSVLEIDHNHDDEELYNFKIITVLKNDKRPFNFDPYLNLNANAI